MRYDAEHKARTRQALLTAAARRLRREGPGGMAVAAVMADAGLTHGGFYAHFASREALVEAAIDEMFREGRAFLDELLSGRPAEEALAAYIGFYLSPRHRDARGSGCPLPFLGSDAPRLPQGARRRFAEGVAGLEAQLAPALAALGVQDPAAEAAGLLAELSGALALARAEPDGVRADEMLERTRRRLLQRFRDGKHS